MFAVLCSQSQNYFHLIELILNPVNNSSRPSLSPALATTLLDSGSVSVTALAYHVSGIIPLLVFL